MTVGAGLLALGLVAVLHWLLGPVRSLAKAQAVLIAAGAYCIAVLKIALMEGAAAGVVGGLFVMAGAGTVAWLLLNATERWTAETARNVALGGFAVMIVSLAL